MKSCLTQWPMDCSLPGSSVLGIFQARTLEWVAISFSSAWKWKVKVKSLSRVWLFATPWTANPSNLGSHSSSGSGSLGQIILPVWISLSLGIKKINNVYKRQRLVHIRQLQLLMNKYMNKPDLIELLRKLNEIMNALCLEHGKLLVNGSFYSLLFNPVPF